MPRAPFEARASGYVLNTVADRDIAEACRAGLGSQTFLDPLPPTRRQEVDQPVAERHAGVAP